MQSQGLVGVWYHECVGESEGEEQEVFPWVCLEEGQTECGLRQVVYSAPHTGNVHVCTVDCQGSRESVLIRGCPEGCPDSRVPDW